MKAKAMNDDEVREGLREMMANWTKLEAKVRAAHPTATPEQVYQMTHTAYWRSLGM